MPAGFHAGSRELQDRFDTRRIADRIDELLVRDEMHDEQRATIEAAPMFFLATADEQGRPTCSYKGGDPGFVTTPDARTVAWPNYDGNGMYLSMGNLLRNPHVGLLFVSFEDPDRLRIQGRASIAPDDPLRSRWPEAQFVVRVAVEQVFPNCPRYVHKMKLVERSRFVPREGCETPVPEWKQMDWSRDYLPVR
ncbi:MAG: uncharacterized protein QOE90_2206 [Thermoplasmata archaeon]|jgi:predicted pyridoxine 5'-phosphate oxidase superfamily flavin-nucleotide-binding protein|nr:uncharacterized protein [Thermoplasmata archaeon]